MMIANPIAHWSDDAVKIYDFLQGTLNPDITFTRSSTAWYFNSSGNLASASGNVARFDYGSPGSTTLQGLLIEQAQTNKVLQCRDLTQSAWTKTNATASLNQTGIDGVASSASSLTATAANATVLQTVTQSAASSVFSVYLMRLTGSGTIQLTQDNGTTWTTVTINSSWQRYQIPAQSTANPTFGIKIVTSGDAVAWDSAQFEAGTLVTSPILTTSAAVTRALDVATVTSIPWFNATAGTFAIEAIIKTTAPSNNLSSADFNDGSINNRIGLYTTPSGTADAVITIAGTSNLSAAVLGGPAVNTVFKQAMRYVSGNNKAAYNGSVDGNGTLTAASLPTGMSQLRIGDREDGTRTMNGWMRRFRYWNNALLSAQMQRITA